MSARVRLTTELYNLIMTDLDRPHAFAWERVGFAFGRRGRTPRGDLVVLGRYDPVRDDDYEEDVTVGARIGAHAIHSTLQHASELGAATFHVHRHDHTGVPQFSPTDLRQLPPVMQPFGVLVPSQPHGLIVLSQDHGIALVLPGAGQRESYAESITVVGAPLRHFRR